MSKSGGKKSALLIGIDRYNSGIISDLSGCSEDVRLVERYLRQSVGISNISKLTSFATPGHHVSSQDDLPTRKNVVSALRKLASEAEEGGFILIHYSGHGTRLDTRFPGMKSNDQDEALVLVSEAHGKVDYLRDVEVAYLLKQITDKGAIVTFILDCCHSGGAVRGGPVLRGVDNIPPEALADHAPICSPDDLAAANWAGQTSDSSRGASVVNHWMTSFKGVEFLAACQANQKAQEIRPAGQGCRGLLTDCLVGVLEKTKDLAEGMTCEMVYNLVSRRVADHPDTKHHQQDVSFGGDRDRAFFGTGRLVSETPRVTSVTEEGTPRRLSVELSAGKAHGVSARDEFALYAPDATFRNIVDYNSPLAVCSVARVDDFVSQAHIILNGDSSGDEAGGSGPVIAGCKAVRRREILKRQVQSPRTARVIRADASVKAGTVEAVEKKIRSEGKLIQLAKGSSAAFFEIRVKEPGHCEISFTHNSKTGGRATVGIQQEADLLPRLAHLVTYYNLLDLSGGASYHRGIAVEKLGFLPREIEPPSPQFLGGGAPVEDDQLEIRAMSEPQDIRDGESIKLRVRNRGHRTVYVEVLDFEPSWRVSRVYPTDGYPPFEITPNDGIDFFIAMSMPEEVPDCIQPETSEAIVVIATTGNQVNFPEDILPELDKTSGCDQPPLEEADYGRGAKGASSSQWLSQRVDMRVIP